eukprot:jgi/Botrbrau1/23380/Bobra.0051s0031.1
MTSSSVLMGSHLTSKVLTGLAFENGQTFFDGLWGGDQATITREFSVVVQRIINMGFNSVRVPFSFPALWKLSIKSQVVSCTITPVSDIKASLTPPGVAVPTADLWPLITSPPPFDQTKCNSWLPTTSVYDIFLTALRFLAANRLYIVVDNHLQNDQTIKTDYNTWISNWVRLAGDIKADPLLSKWVMFDLLNEPDAQDIRWITGLPVGGMQQAYLAAMDAIYAVHPKAVFIIEGTGQLGLANNWGDGTWTDAGLIAQRGVQDASGFFKTLLTKTLPEAGGNWQPYLLPHYIHPDSKHIWSWPQLEAGQWHWLPSEERLLQWE